ncbi:GNAT family N-acetyltransferase [Hymenobacter busanensis]|uniref:GNAT family N-acetyltransferase n=1 Tax=Hymenobacter busanensis TaxID=2607656 RepID=A0A7L5A008_9BACT|nr:GNAT family N-acetyltransferase [Hymenobacter busanensis]KAA9338711.1 GNAT family N-acetyltransferase [Hymenobacter busanensis]QHJ08858.1 GNAT family N-acetyltransferase [Hymenobacter busanensis]
MSSPLRLVVAKRNAATAAQLAELGRQTFRDTYADQNTPEDMAQYLAEHFGPEQQLAELEDANTIFLLAYMQQELVGYAKLYIGSTLGAEAGADVRTRAELQRLYVRTDWIGTGLGAALLRRCFDEAKARGCRSVVLTVWEKNERAQEFYRRKGFKQIGETEYRVGNDVQNDYILRKGL